MTPTTSLRQGAALVLLAGAVLVAYYLVSQFSNGNQMGIILPVAGVLCGLIFLSPRLGLYAFCFTLVLIPYDWRIEGLKLTSANALMVGAALAAWATSVAIRRKGLRLSVLILPLLVVAVVAWLNFFRYGSGFLYVPYVLTEAILLFVLATQLIRTQEHLEQLLMALALVMIVRNLMDLGVTLYSFQSGDALGAIRHDRLLVAGTVTTESEWRSLFLPILALGALFARKKSLQMLLLGAVFLDVAWLAFAASRTAILGLGLAMVFLPIFAPPEMRKRVLRLAVPAAAVAAILMTVFSEAWTHIVITSQEDVFTGSLDEGRWVLWGGALEEFWKHPWIGNSVGAKHTFVLENARSMGLVFLVPYGIAVYLIWRHLSKVRRQRPPGASQGYICGLQVTILMVAVMGVTGSLLNTGTNAFFFWMLVGAAEGYYLQQRKEQQTGEAPAVQGYLSRLPFRRRRVASAGSVFS